jgi:hypothetical protein
MTSVPGTCERLCSCARIATSVASSCAWARSGGKISQRALRPTGVLCQCGVDFAVLIEQRRRPHVRRALPIKLHGRPYGLPAAFDDVDHRNNDLQMLNLRIVHHRVDGIDGSERHIMALSISVGRARSLVHSRLEFTLFLNGPARARPIYRFASRSVTSGSGPPRNGYITITHTEKYYRTQTIGSATIARNGYCRGRNVEPYRRTGQNPHH